MLLLQSDIIILKQTLLLQLLKPFRGKVRFRVVWATSGRGLAV